MAFSKIDSTPGTYIFTESSKATQIDVFRVSLVKSRPGGNLTACLERTCPACPEPVEGSSIEGAEGPKALGMVPPPLSRVFWEILLFYRAFTGYF